MFLDFKVNILDFCCCWEMFYSHTLHSCFPLYPDCWLQFKTVLSNVKATSHMWKWSGVKVAQSCPTLCDPMDCTVHGILQVRILEWVAFPFSRGIFLTQGSNPGLPHCRRTSYQLSHKGSVYFVGSGHLVSPQDPAIKLYTGRIGIWQFWYNGEWVLTAAHLGVSGFSPEFWFLDSVLDINTIDHVLDEVAD